jgi:hypothetical protein
MRSQRVELRFQQLLMESSSDQTSLQLLTEKTAIGVRWLIVCHGPKRLADLKAGLVAKGYLFSST